MSRKSFVASDFLKEMGRKGFGRPIPQGNEPKSFVASDFLKEMGRNGFGRPDCIAISAALSGPGRGSRAVAVKPG